jgi:FlgD Ig-like domain
MTYSGPLLALLLLLGHARVDPPYGGTVWIDPDIITEQDASSFTSFTYSGRGIRAVFDRRAADWVQVDGYLFEVIFDDGTTSEFIVNPEFGSLAAAQEHVERYAYPIGQLSTTLRRDMREVWINGGDEAFGGGNNSILIHTVYGERAQSQGFLEEVLVHEAAHTSLDADHANTAGWLAAQASDPESISTYARDNPTREDVAESILPYYAVRYRSDRISLADYNKMTQAIPARLAYFDAIAMDWYPMLSTGTNVREEVLPASFQIGNPYPNPFAESTTIPVTARAGGGVLVIMDSLGREVTRLGDGRLSPGANELKWDGRDAAGVAVASGVYLIAVLDADGTSAPGNPRAVTVVR